MVFHTHPATVDGVRYFRAEDWYPSLRFEIGDRVRLLVSRGHETFRVGTVVGRNLALWDMQHDNPRPYQVRLDGLRIVHRLHEHQLMETEL